ncbi:TerB family tellurite resistance protein, partial [Streptomyces sp. HCCB10043]
LAGAGRESVLLQGARIALADGPYCAAERQVLTTVGSALGIPAEETARLLAEAARTPS